MEAITDLTSSQAEEAQPTTPFNILNELNQHRGLLTVNEVARVLNLSSFTIYRMAQRKQMPSLMLGGSRRFDPATLAHWLVKKEPQLSAAARWADKAA